ncbi:transcriptional regulator [Mycobacterium sp. MS1601]|uniref:winged helix-turn-helix transcriptional regulator n=1 Tax=Mycobacterium sp. MS1601 TaxID=1936029 RepID=UPI000979374C|nr:helix-turn-helix domain-containing protein [Mycobacterium sp. MS1601]AQA02185.1 transcriptional regulator [Mycobacterium sp. MS1601]
MKKKLNDDCPIARAMAVLGERWSMLILREAMQGRSRFSDFRSELGVAPDILSSRLSALVAAGVFEVVDYQEPGDRRRQRYELTEAGHEASTILVALGQWGRTHLPSDTDSGYRFVETASGKPVRAVLSRRDGRIIEPTEVLLAPRPGETVSQPIPPDAPN